MTEQVSGQAVVAAIQRVGHALIEQKDRLTELDQALGDGDLGITLNKAAKALLAYVETTEADDIGKFLAGAGMASNRAAPSTLGTLLATALMRAGKEVKGQTELAAADLVATFRAADQGIQERGKAEPGDKTIVDAIHPASQAFAEAVESGASIAEAGQQALAAAKEGRDSVTELRSKVGRASWVGERTQGKVDPGCEAFVVILGAIVGG